MSLARNQIVTRGIILTRVDYGEADRIITLITPDHGKLRLMAKGVRRVKSKLAGGIELFSVSQITFIAGRGDIGTLVSTRLEQHYRHIVEDINRVQLGYELIKLLNKVTEDEPESQYFELLRQTFAALDEPTVPAELIKTWFAAQLLRIGGHTPNLETDASGQPLDATTQYDFDTETMNFTARAGGRFDAASIKFLRLIFGGNQPAALARVSGSAELARRLNPTVQNMLSSHQRV